MFMLRLANRGVYSRILCSSLMKWNVLLRCRRTPTFPTKLIFALWVFVLVQMEQTISSPDHRRLCVISELFWVWRCSDQKRNTSQVQTQRPSTRSHFWDWNCAESVFYFDENTKSFPGSFHYWFAVLFMMWLQCISKLVFEIHTFLPL